MTRSELTQAAIRGVLDILVVVLLAGCGDPTPVTPDEPGGSPSLALVSFTMNEFWDEDWYYAPSIELAETGGVGDARVVKMVFHVPGLAEPLPAVCGGVVVPRGRTAELFYGGSDQWGSWEVELDGGGARWSGGEASATIYYVDAADQLDSLAIHGPVVPAPRLRTGPPGTHWYSGCTAASERVRLLRLVQGTPADGATAVPVLEPTIRFRFSEPISDATLWDALGKPRFILTLDGVRVDAGVWCGGPVGEPGCPIVGILPHADLVPGRTYHVTIGTGVRGVWGGELSSPIDLSFTTVSVPSGPSAAALSLVSFTMNELQSDGLPGHWFYAPLITLAETGGVSDASVVKMVFTIPGVVEGHPICASGVRVAKGGTAELFHEIYGDWELTLDRGVDGARASGPEASATLYFLDADNRLDSLAVHGPIVPAPPLTTYTGGSSHGYSTCGSGR